MQQQAKKTEKEKEKKNKPANSYIVYTPKDKANALALYATHKNYNKVSRLTGINPITISKWQHEDKNGSLELAKTAQEAFICSATRIIEKALEKVENSIIEGYNDPYKLTLIASMLYDKRALAKGESTANVSTIVKLEDFPE